LPSERSDAVLLNEIRDSIRLVGDYVDGLDLATFDASLLQRDATAYRLLLIGEAAARLSPELKASLTGIDWRGMISLRHRLAHDYGSASSLILWTIATVEVPELSTAIEGH